MNGPSIPIAGTQLKIFPERVALWRERQIVLAADVHVGKEATFRRHGVPLPEGGTDERLDRLTRCVDELDAQRLVILGDFVHAPVGLTTAVTEKVAAWSKQLDADIQVVEGNHDRRLRGFPTDWAIELTTGPLQIGPFALRHDPGREAAGYVLAGHLHPTVDLRQGGDRLRLPCFRFDEGVGVLPAFTPFSNGVRQEARAGRRLYAVTDDDVIDLTAVR